MDVFEAMGTAVSMRWLKPDPVPDDLVEKVIWAATRAASPSNVQPWDFVVVRDEQTRRDIAELLSVTLERHKERAKGPQPEDPMQRRMFQGAGYLAEHLSEVPVLVFVCGDTLAVAQESLLHSSVFAAAQNLMVAARALGLGAAYTLLHAAGETEIKDRLGIPEPTKIFVTLPIGWPARPFGHMTRKPIDEVLHLDHW